MDSLISDQILSIFNNTLYFCIRPIVLVLGVATCSFSAYVFYRMGLNDSVRVSFFVLCIYDLGFVLMSSVGAVCIILNIGFPQVTSAMTFNPFYVNNISYWCAGIFYHSSLMTTGFISGVRCCCVAIPFKFRKVFSTKRTAAALLIIFIISCTLQLPVVATQYVSYTKEKNNLTKIAILSTSNHDITVAVNDILNRNILSWITMAVMFISLIVMTAKLKSSVEFRMLATTGHHSSSKLSAICCCSKYRTEQLKPSSQRLFANLKTQDLDDKIQNDSRIISNSDHREGGTGKETKSTLENLRELQLIKSVALITAMVVALALPFMVYSLVRRLMPQFNAGNIYGNLFSVITTLSAVCAYLNSALNVFIFYCCNTKFKAVANDIFSCFQNSRSVKQ
uniref:G-protein coupled receptors family 1 profile domain-containing protein n=1 Tax=Biomphalaria glabrata TaxID=6526 RepID=A0A2C9KPL7_BIOGL